VTILSQFNGGIAKRCMADIPSTDGHSTKLQENRGLLRADPFEVAPLLESLAFALFGSNLKVG
jgi:hypothetical protein